MKNPNGPSIEQQEAWQDALDDEHHAMMNGPRIQQSIGPIVEKFKDAFRLNEAVAEAGTAEAMNPLMVNERIQSSMAMQATWWINLYLDGRITSSLCRTKEEALNRCTWTGDKPDAIQIEVLLTPIL